MHLDSKKKNFLKVPKIKDTLVTYKEIARDNIISIFQLDDYSKLSPFEAFLENGDHGAEHTYNVFKKSLEIAEAVEKDSAVSIDKELLYMMSAMHDSGRFRLPIYKEGDTEKQQQAKENKRKKSEREHARYGVAQVKLGIKKLKEKNIMISDEDQKKIEDYVLNHDFFNERLEGDRYHEPVSLEGQIVRLADRISVPVGEEIKRYRETGKRLGTPYFNKNITWKERIDFSFVNMGEYIKNKTFDEFTFFLALLSQVPGDFSHPLLAEIYKQWGSNKDQAISCILQIAEDESYNKEDIQKMKLLINAYLEYFKIHF